MTDNKNAVKNLAEVIRERSEVIAELIVACVTATKTFSYGVSDSKEQEKDCARVKQAVVPEEPATEEEVEEVKPKKKKVSSTRKEREEAEVLPEEITEESLAEVSYNGLKKLAKDLGVSASGDRETLTANILASVSEDEVEEEDSDEEVTSSEEEIEDAEFSEEDEDNEEEEEDSLAEQIEQATKDMTVEELADLLVSYKLPAKGKRQALIDAIIKGVEDGIIEFNTGDEEDEDDEDEEEDIDDAETVEEEVDEDEVDDSPRGKAVQDLKDSIEAEFEEGSISRKDLITYINKRMGTKNRMKTVDDADLLAKYCELQATLIDDEGDLHEEKEPYVLNGEYHCCGEALQKDEDGDLVCPICGTCYDGEE